MTSHFIPRSIRDAVALVAEASARKNSHSASAFAVYMIHHVIGHVHLDELDVVLVDRMTDLLDARTLLDMRADGDSI